MSNESYESWMNESPKSQMSLKFEKSWQIWWKYKLAKNSDESYETQSKYVVKNGQNLVNLVEEEQRQSSALLRDDSFSTFLGSLINW